MRLLSGGLHGETLNAENPLPVQSARDIIETLAAKAVVDYFQKKAAAMSSRNG